MNDYYGSTAQASPLTMVIYFAVLVFMVVCQWKIFVKAGKPGWACLIPIYSTIVLLDIIKKPTWWLVMILIVPFVNVIFAIMMIVNLGKAFGKSTGWSVGLLLILAPVGFALLAFTDAQYTEPVAA